MDGVETMKLYIAVALVVSAAALSGCVTSKQIIAPDGSTGYSLKCNGMANSWGDCMAKAGELCGAKGYTIIERNGEAVNMSFGTGYANTSAASMSGVSTTGLGRSMVVACRG